MSVPPHPLSMTLRYDEATLRRAVQTFVRRRMLQSPRAWLTVALLLAASAALGWGAGSAFGIGMALAGLALAGLLVALVWRAHLRRTLEVFRAMDPPEALVTLDADMLTVASSAGSAGIPWSRFTGRWELDGCWMLFLAVNQFITLPTADLSDEARTFIRLRVPGDPDPAAGRSGTDTRQRSV